MRKSKEANLRFITKLLLENLQLEFDATYIGEIHFSSKESGDDSWDQIMITIEGAEPQDYTAIIEEDQVIAVRTTTHSPHVPYFMVNVSDTKVYVRELPHIYVLENPAFEPDVLIAAVTAEVRDLVNKYSGR